jgi:two-component system, OmpR family, response regulator
MVERPGNALASAGAPRAAAIPGDPGLVKQSQTRATPSANDAQPRLQVRPADRPVQTEQSEVVVLTQDATLLRAIPMYLQSAGYTTVCMGTDSGEYYRIGHSGARIAIIDADSQLFGESGAYNVLRSMLDVFVIVLGGESNPIDRVFALDNGADAYVSRPLNFHELVAEVRAISRRLEKTAVRPGNARYFEFEGFRFNVADSRLISPLGRAIRLSPTETALLRLFLESPDHLLDRDAISSVLPASELARDLRASDSHVSRLRKKLRSHGESELILTVRGRGYIWGVTVRTVAA